MQTPSPVVLIMTTAPDMETARTIARALVEGNVAACVSIGQPVLSIYRWQGAIEETSEIPLQIKTSAARYQQVEAAIKAAHPYDVPEIIAVSAQAGLPIYLNWVRDVTAPSSHA